MKPIRLLLVFSVLQLTATGQSGAPQSAIADEGSLVRESQILFNTSDELAWLGFYLSKRESYYTGPYRTLSAAHQRDLREIVRMMQVHVDGSYALEVAQYLEANKSDQGWAHLEKAFSLRPDDPEIWDDMLCYSIIRNRDDDTRELARRMAASGIFSDPLYAYSRNVLSSVEKDGILITHGYRDTYPLLVLQYALGERKDVRIICLEWSGSAQFASQVSRLTGVTLRTGDGYDWLTGLTQSEAAGKLYFALTLPPAELRRFEDQLFCTGLAMKYSRQSLANLQSLAHNWESLFDHSHLESEEPLNRNYLVPLVLLSDYYRMQGNVERSKEVTAIASKIAAGTGNLPLVKPYLD